MHPSPPTRLFSARSANPGIVHISSIYNRLPTHNKFSSARRIHSIHLSLSYQLVNSVPTHKTVRNNNDFDFNTQKSNILFSFLHNNIRSVFHPHILPTGTMTSIITGANNLLPAAKPLGKHVPKCHLITNDLKNKFSGLIQ
jgi:hypothetical protein